MTTTTNLDLNLFAEASPWAQCLTDFLQSIYSKSKSKESLASYSSNLRRFFTDPLKTPDAYTRADVEAFLNSPSTGRCNRRASPSTSTRNVRLAVISSFYAYASIYTIADQEGNPTPILQRPSPTTGIHPGRPARSYKSLSFEQIQAFFSCIPHDTVIGLRDRALFLTYFFTARRRNEILFLKWGDIEKTTIVETDGTRREGFTYRFTGKGKAGEIDTAELPRLAKLAIDEYLEASGRLATMTPESYVFTDGLSVRN